MSDARRHRRVWYRADGEVREYKTACKASQLIRQAMGSAIVSRGRYFATYHGQFVVRDVLDQGRPVACFSDKDAMLAYLLII